MVPGFTFVALDHFQIISFPAEAIVLKRIHHVLLNLFDRPFVGGFFRLVAPSLVVERAVGRSALLRLFRAFLGGC